GPTAYLLHLLAHPIAFPQPRWAIEAHGQAWAAEPRHLVCNGAFQLVEREPGTRLLLKRNPAYTGRFPGNADLVELLVFSKWRLALEAYASDAVDLIDMAAADARSMAVARTFYSEDMVFVPLLNTNYLIFLVDRPPFDDVRVRLGFAHATDQHAISPDQLLQGNVPATGGFVPPWMPGHSADIGLAFDPERGRRLLTAAGFPDGGDFPTITFLHTHGLCDESLIPFLQDQWRQNLGIDVEVTVLPWREFQKRVRTDPPHLMLASWIADYPDPDNFLRMVFHSTRGLNEPGWNHARFDALVDEAARVTDQNLRMELYGKADRILSAEATVIMPLSYGRGAILLKPWVSHASKQRVSTRYLKELSVEVARAPSDRSVLT
ncbi:MAG: peptide ABC transporter substrate-binding protein, partial [Actinomycetota bacterium]|nr:peptide ABC transporter substrate-binding protein [Actinomycetota bacterium]